MDKDKKGDVKLTISQQNVLKEMLDFIEHPSRRVFILKGYAGTGKTTLMKFLINELSKKNKNYQLLASTGRAAKVLANLSERNGNTSTIHSMVYSFNGLNMEYDGKEEPNVDKDGQLFLVFEPARLDVTTSPEKVYIIDEASMVSDVASKDITQAKFGSGRLLKELLEFDSRSQSKFIFVGDPCQLPPIEEYYSPALMKSYFMDEFGMEAQEEQLTEIMRQKGDSGIVDASKQVRGLYQQAPSDKRGYGSQKLWGFLPFRRYQDIELHASMDEMTEQYVESIVKRGLDSAVFICRSNKACNDLSATIRKRLGMPAGKLETGDLLMVVQNNIQTGLMNGDMVVVEQIGTQQFRRGCLTFRQIQVKELFTGNSYSSLIIEEILHQARPNLDSAQQQSLFVDFIHRMWDRGITQKNNHLFNSMMMNDPYLNALRCVFGYAVTCHKSQGGEWDDVFVYVPRNITLNPTKETYQWIYTAMTRAKKKLHMVDDFYIK